MVHDVDDVAVWCPDEKPAHTPRLCNYRFHDLVAKFLSLFISSFDVVRADGNDRVFGAVASRALRAGRSPADLALERVTVPHKSPATSSNRYINGRSAYGAGTDDQASEPANIRQGDWSIFEIGGTRGAGVAAARSSPFSVRHSEQIQQGCARPCSPAGRSLGGGRRAGEGARRPAPRPSQAEGNRCQPSPPGACPWWTCSSPGNRLPGRLPSLLPGVCCPAWYRCAVAGIGWPRRLRRASRDEGAWPRATRRRIRPSRSVR